MYNHSSIIVLLATSARKTIACFLMGARLPPNGNILGLSTATEFVFFYFFPRDLSRCLGFSCACMGDVFLFIDY